MPQLTDHALQQFVSRWRPGLTIGQVRMELRTLVEEAAPTRRRTILRDARIYVAVSRAGERISFAVRDGMVVTVLPPGDPSEGDLTPAADMVDDSRETVAACRALIAKEAPAIADAAREKELTRTRRMNAITLIREWRSGHRKVSADPLARAHTILDINFGDPLPKE